MRLVGEQDAHLLVSVSADHKRNKAGTRGGVGLHNAADTLCSPPQADSRQAKKISADSNAFFI